MGAFPKNLNHPNAQFKQLSKELRVPKGSIFYTFLKIRVVKCVEIICILYTMILYTFLYYIVPGKKRSAGPLPGPKYSLLWRGLNDTPY